MSPTGDFKTPERSFGHADVVRLANNAIKRFYLYNMKFPNTK